MLLKVRHELFGFRLELFRTAPNLLALAAALSSTLRSDDIRRRCRTSRSARQVRERLIYRFNRLLGFPLHPDVLRAFSLNRGNVRPDHAEVLASIRPSVFNSRPVFALITM